MSTNFRPKAKIMFPNTWAVDSFLNKLKGVMGWEFKRASDGNSVRLKPRGSTEYILIGLLKSGGAVVAEINSEKVGMSDAVWIMIYDFARRYRC